MVNRYTRRNNYATFQPMSFEQASVVPMAWQQKEDSTLAAALANQKRINALSWHEDRARELESIMDESINTLVDDISQNGIQNMNTSRKLLDLRRQQEELFGHGSEGAKITGALANRQAFQEELSKAEGTEGWKREQMALYDQRSQNLYKNEGDIGYNASLLNPDINYAELAAEALREIPLSTIETDTGWTRHSDGYRWVNTTTKKVSNGTPQALTNYALDFMQGDPAIMGYLQDRALVDEELYTTKDEMGNVIKDGKYYDGKTYGQNLINNRLVEAASEAMTRAYENEFKQTHDMKNVSESQLYESYIDGMMSNPIFRDIGYSNNPQYSEAAINAVTNPEKTQYAKITDNEGNVMNSEDFRVIVKDIYKQRNEGNTTTFSNTQLEKIADEMYAYFTSGTVIDNFSESGRSMLDMLFNNTPGEMTEQALRDAIGHGEFKIKALTKDERSELQNKADSQLEFQMIQYNSQLPKNNQVKNISEYKKKLVEDAKNQAKIPVRSVDYQIPSNDLISREVVDGNFSVLQGQSIVLEDGSGEKIDLSPEKQTEYLSNLSKEGKIKVSEPRRTLNGYYPGGKLYNIQVNGKTYKLYTEPASQAEEQAFRLDSQVQAWWNNPLSYGTENYEKFIPVPHAANPSLMIQYSPEKYWENGKLVKGVRSQVVDKNGVPQSSEVRLSKQQFEEERERYRAVKLYPTLYKAQNLNKKINPNS